jgi:hypothetical protein
MDLYELLHAKGLTKSHRHFSEHWCDRAPNYVALGNGISESSCLAIIRKLWRQRTLKCRLLALRIIHEIVWGLDVGI